MTPLAVMKGPTIDYAALSPLFALLGGAAVVLLLGLVNSPFVRRAMVPAISLLAMAATIALSVWQWGENTSIVSESLRIDDLSLALTIIFVVTAMGAALLSLRAPAAEQAGHGEYHALLLSAVAGMVVLVAAQNLVSLFLGLELLSISLYVLCATEVRRVTSLESGLKYLIVGSVGSATLLYGLALIYGATGATDYAKIAAALDGSQLISDALMLTGVALVVAGLAFKASVAPFHQWTPDVYEGAPTPITTFMAVATKAAAFGVLLRFFDVALIDAQAVWGPALAVLAAVTIVVGNVGALGQSSLKRMLAWSGVAQAGYLLIGVVVGTRLGVQATVFYLAVYLAMNVAAFAVIVARERESGEGDHIGSLAGLGATRPLLAWPMTIAMLSLAGIPATAGFIGKFYLIRASVEGGYTWLGVVLVIGSMISLAYYLRVLVAIWMRDAPVASAGPAVGDGGRARARPIMAGGAPESDAEATVAGIEGGGSQAVTTRSDHEHGRGPVGSGVREDRRSEPAAVGVAVLFGAASLVGGIIPGPLFDVVRDAGQALGNLL